MLQTVTCPILLGLSKTYIEMHSSSRSIFAAKIGTNNPYIAFFKKFQAIQTAVTTVTNYYRNVVKQFIAKRFSLVTAILKNAKSHFVCHTIVTIRHIVVTLVVTLLVTL